MRKRPKTLQELCNQIPPPLMLALARNGQRKRMTMPQLVKATGIPERTLIRISAKLSWNDVSLDKISAIANACGVNFLRLENILRYIRMNCNTAKPFSHLTTRQRTSLLNKMHEINVSSGYGE